MPLLNKIEGCLLGLAFGDAAGAPVEGRHPLDVPLVQLTRADWPPFATLRRAGLYTDDTQVALLLLESLLVSGQFSVDVFAERLVQASLGERVKRFGVLRGTGLYFRAAVDALGQGVPWNQSGQDSEGNGAAMRVAPLALFYWNDRPRLIRAAIEQSLVTHRKTDGILAAVALALFIALELDPTEPQGPEERLRLIRSRLESAREILASEYQPYLLETVPQAPAFMAMMDLLQDSVTRTAAQNALHIAAKAHKTSKSPIRLGTEGYAPASVTCALSVALTAKTWFDGLRDVLALGGDADTTGAMTGALLGARFGVEGLPPAWIEKAPWVGFLREKAHELHRVMTQGEPLLPRQGVIEHERALCP